MRLLEKNPITYHMLRYEEHIIGYVAIMLLKPGKLEKILR